MAANQGGLAELILTEGVSDEYRDEMYSGAWLWRLALACFFSKPQTKFSFLLII